MLLCKQQTRLNTFQSEPALNSSTTWATITRAKLKNMAIHTPVIGLSLFLPRTTFDRYWLLQTLNTPQKLQFWRCFNPAVEPSQIAPCQNPYPCPFFLLPIMMIIAAYCIPPTNECCNKYIISVIHLTHQCSYCHAWSVYYKQSWPH